MSKPCQEDMDIEDGDKKSKAAQTNNRNDILNLFRVGNKVRIAHEDNFSFVFDCEGGLSSSYNNCPYKIKKKTTVGLFGIIEEINKGELYAINQMIEDVKLKILLKEKPTWKKNDYIVTESTNVVNYSLLGNKAADEVFELTCDKDFDVHWSFIFQDTNSLVNDQMLRSMKKIDKAEKAVINSTLKYFRQETHAFYHRLLEYNFGLNETLRVSTHEEYFEKKKSLELYH
jgi:hypothetical protein